MFNNSAIRVLSVFLFCVGLFCLAQAQVPMTGAGKATPGGFSPTCTSSSNFLARTSGLSNSDKSNYDTLLCTLDTNGVGCAAANDFLYILAAPNSTTALLNLCSASFALTITGSETFVSYRGYTGDGATGFLNTHYNPSTNAIFTTQTSAAAAVYLPIAPAAATAAELGVFGPPAIQIVPNNSGTDSSLVNTSTGSGMTAFVVSGVFMYSNQAVLTTQYINGTAQGTTPGGLQSPPNQAIYIGARDNAGTADLFSNDRIGAAAFTSGLTATQAANWRSAIQTFMTAVGN